MNSGDSGMGGSHTSGKLASALCLALTLSSAPGCGSSDEAAKGGTKELPTGPFAVSDYFVPGLRPLDTPGRLELNVNSGCKARPPGARGDCYAVVSKSEFSVSQSWLCPAGNTEGPGLPLPRNLSRVSFFAATTEATSLYVFRAGGDRGTIPSRVVLRYPIGYSKRHDGFGELGNRC